MSEDLKNLFESQHKNVLVEELNSKSVTKKGNLFVYDDDFNTFDWVIQSFMEICNHSYKQSEQLSLFVHYKGKAIVKTGSIKKLTYMKECLINRGISAFVESLVED